MNARIAFHLLTRSQRLARIFALHVLRKLDEAEALRNEPPGVRILGLIDVLVSADAQSIREVSSELRANRVRFSIHDDLPNHLVGVVDGVPRLQIELGDGRTLYLMIEAADGVVFRRQ